MVHFPFYLIVHPYPSIHPFLLDLIHFFYNPSPLTLACPPPWFQCSLVIIQKVHTIPVYCNMYGKKSHFFPNRYKGAFCTYLQQFFRREKVRFFVKNYKWIMSSW